MTVRRAHVLLTEDLLEEIDALVGPRGRSAFLVETARNEVRRQKLLQFLESKRPAWQDHDHPDLKEGTAHWVRRLRSENEARATGGRTKPEKRAKTR